MRHLIATQITMPFMLQMYGMVAVPTAFLKLLYIFQVEKVNGPA